MYSFSSRKQKVYIGDNKKILLSIKLFRFFLLAFRFSECNRYTEQLCISVCVYTFILQCLWMTGFMTHSHNAQALHVKLYKPDHSSVCFLISVIYV